MRKALIIFFGFLFAGFAAFTQSELRIIESMVMPSRILNQEVRFSVVLPENYYETKASFPVVYLLHGLGDDETSWLEYGQISQYADKAVNDKEIIPMIFVMPQGFRTYYVNDYKASFLYQDMFVNELVPFIDSLFRTIPEKGKRAVMGYSMGGFGAMILPLKHPEMFGVSVPLSMSVRTDDQYKTEDAGGWDEQWGRLFGEPGFKDSARITEYYRQNSPFHVLPKMQPEIFKNLRIYMDNGDKEQTLCRSNEELHILMRRLGIPHEYRVRNGGHSFEYWCTALPDAMNFISDAFELKPYRGDKVLGVKTKAVTNNQLQTLEIGKEKITVFVPEEYAYSNRNYPALYLIGDFDHSQIETIAGVVNFEIEENFACPMLLVFLPEKDTTEIKRMISMAEEKMHIRKGYRFSAIGGFRNGANVALQMGLASGQFCAVMLSDGFLSKENIDELAPKLNRENLKRTTFFIETPDKGNYFEGNGNLHVVLRDKDVYHEYRVREGDGGFDWFLGGLPEIIQFTAKRFHK
jgi:enterochelin esterase-like enzyme